MPCLLLKRVKKKAMMAGLYIGDFILKKNHIFKRSGTLIVLLVLTGLLFSSCRTRYGSFTVISTNNVDWSRAAEFQRVPGKVEGVDKLYIIVIVPTKFNLSLEEAVADALKKVPGAVALVNAALYGERFYIPWVYGTQQFVVTGQALVDPQLAGEPSATGYIALTPDGKGGYLREDISRGEYLAMAAEAEAALN